MSTSSLELDPYVLPQIEGTRILDLGCGYGHWAHIMTTHRHLMPCGIKAHLNITGVDLHPGNVEFCKEKGFYEEVIHGDILEYLNSSPDKSFETIMAMDIIEHLEKDQGKLLLAELDRVASKAIIISTPNSEELRGGLEGITGFNQWESHISSWSIEDFLQAGYTITGIRHNLRQKLYRLRGMYRFFNVFPAAHDFLNMIALRNPKIAETLLATKVVSTQPSKKEGEHTS